MTKFFSSCKGLGFPAILFAVSVFCIGCFYEFLSCIFSVCLLVYLGITFHKQGRLSLRFNLTAAAVGVTVLLYGLSTVWALDRGMALIGLIKYLPLPLFLIAIQQDPKAKGQIRSLLPYLAAAAAAISSLGSLIPVLHPFFTVDGRLAGFFQYPNSFALFLLVAEIVLLTKEKFKIYDHPCLAVLIFGLFYTGSRTVFLLAVAANLFLLFSGKNKKVKLGTLCGIGILGVLLLFFGGDILGRFASISLSSSTFIGRFLYFQDALPVILRHPLGLGYMGYHFLQQSFQSGVYSVAFVHNDFLQLMLDVGWLPALLWLAAILRPLFGKRIPAADKLILAVMLLHCCFDFDLQFITLFLLLILFTDYDAGKEVFLKRSALSLSGLGVLAVICLYFGSALTLAQFGQREAAHALYPFETRNQTNLLTQIEDLAKADQMADDILKRNEYVTLAYSVKARYAYSQGDFGQLIAHKNALFERAPFQYAEYEEYCYMLINGITLYTRNGDTKSASVCKQELLAAQKAVAAQADRLSTLGTKITDQPVTELPADIQNYIIRMEES